MPGNQNFYNPWAAQYPMGSQTAMQPSYNQSVNPYNGSGYQTFAPQQQSYDQSSDISGVVWALGESGAASYPVARGSKLLIMDATPNSPYFWIKETDQYTGRPLPMRKFRYEEVSNIQNGSQMPMIQSQMSGNQQEVLDYVPKSEFDALKNEFGFKSMAWESSSNYSLLDHVHNYSRVSVDSTIPRPEESQISSVSAILTIRVGSKSTTIYSPKISVYKQPKPYIGQLKFMAMTSFPQIDETSLDFNGWTYPDGRAVSREIFREAFQYFGTEFGAGDGETTFNIPCLTNFIKIAQPRTTPLDEKLVQEREQIEVLKRHDHALGNIGLNGTIQATTEFKSVNNTQAGDACHGSLGGGAIKKISYDFYFKATDLTIQSDQKKVESSEISKATHPTYNKLPVLMYIGVRGR